MVGWGSICGLPTSPMAEVMLKGLPPPLEADPAKHHRFQFEESQLRLRSLEPFYDFVDVAAGAKHYAFINREGNLVFVGSNRYGQVGQPTQHEDPQLETMPFYYDIAGDVPSSSAAAAGAERHPETEEEKGEGVMPKLNRVACGSNYTIAYHCTTTAPSSSSSSSSSTAGGTVHVVCVGNNHVGQLGLGHKQVLHNRDGFASWAPQPTWASAEDLASGIREIVCGFNHTFIWFHSGAIYACGSNTWGELGIGTTTSPMQPVRLRFFDERQVRVTHIAAGNSFSLFLTESGKVYGCGATNYGQLPPNVFVPTIVPLVRVEEGVAVTGKLIPIKTMGCVGDAVVYVTRRNEVLVQGSMPQLGVSLPCPRYRKLKFPVSATEATIESNEQEEPETGGRATDTKRRRGGPEIVRVHSGSTAALLETTDGCLYAFGSNLEGQISLEPQRKSTAAATSSSSSPKSRLQVAAAHFTQELCRLPLQRAKGVPSDIQATYPTRVAVSSSGCILLDHAEQFRQQPTSQSSPTAAASHLSGSATEQQQQLVWNPLEQGRPLVSVQAPIELPPGGNAMRAASPLPLSDEPQRDNAATATVPLQHSSTTSHKNEKGSSALPPPLPSPPSTTATPRRRKIKF